MTGPVYWEPLVFIAGALVGTAVAAVAVTYIFWQLIDKRIDDKIDARLRNPPRE